MEESISICAAKSGDAGVSALCAQSHWCTSQNQPHRTQHAAQHSSRARKLFFANYGDRGSAQNSATIMMRNVKKMRFSVDITADLFFAP
jgi:hypothetical protein